MTNSLKGGYITHQSGTLFDRLLVPFSTAVYKQLERELSELYKAKFYKNLQAKCDQEQILLETHFKRKGQITQPSYILKPYFESKYYNIGCKQRLKMVPEGGRVLVYGCGNCIYTTPCYFLIGAFGVGWLNNKSRMSREAHIRFCEKLKGEVPFGLLDPLRSDFSPV